MVDIAKPGKSILFKFFILVFGQFDPNSIAPLIRKVTQDGILTIIDF